MKDQSTHGKLGTKAHGSRERVSCVARRERPPVEFLTTCRPVKMRKQLDSRIPTLISNNVKLGHRSFIVLVGDKGRDQVSPVRSKRERKPDSSPDCEFALPIVSSTRFCPAICALVLQEGSGLYQVRS